MKTIGHNEIWSYLNTEKSIQKINTSTTVREAEGHNVKSYLELATKIAELQFKNPDFVLMFRGQRMDHRNTHNNTSLKASLFRPIDDSITAPDMDVLDERFRVLEACEQALIQEYRTSLFPDVERLERQRILRWAILQHYEVCATPLLDITHSLRIAASFATEKSDSNAFLFVLAIPNLSGAITASAEAGLQIIRLASVCPPTAIRPHIQEGYLLGEYPDLATTNQKALYGHYEIDFGRRLIAKFRFNPKTFWKKDTFPLVSHKDLYPRETADPLFRLTTKIKNTAITRV